MTDVFYSISPFGTGDIQTGSGNVEWTSGVATTSVSQTGNIGIGCAIVGNGITVYISAINSPTSFDVITATGGTPGDQGSTGLTSIHHVWANLATAEAAYTGASFLNTTDLVANTFKAHLCCYYDHDDQTADISNTSFSSATVNDTYKPIVFTPNGGTESINIQGSGTGVLDTNKYYIAPTGAVTPECINIAITHIDIIGIQFKVGLSGVSFLNSLRITSGANGGIINISKMITDGSSASNSRGIRTDSTATININNSIAHNIATGSSFSSFVYNSSTGTINAEYCLISVANTGYSNPGGGTYNCVNCVAIGNADDFLSVSSVDHCASEDGDGTNAVTLADGTYAYLNIWEDHVNGDFNLVNDTSDTSAPQNKGVDIPEITTDIIGVLRNDPPDIGAFEFPGAGPAFDAILKRWNGSAWIKAKMQRYNGSSFEDVTLKYYDGTFKTVDTSGV